MAGVEGPARGAGAVADLTLGVVVPTLGEVQYLPRLLERLLRAAPGDAPDEIIVADGGSRDGTAELARRAGALLVECAPGRGVQLAAGARAASADILLFLHADHLPRAGALGAMREAYGDARVEWSAMRQVIDAPGRFYRLVERAADARARRGVVYGDSGLAVRRPTYEAVGGFRDLALFEDVELSARLRRRAPVHWMGDAALLVSARRWEAEGRLACTLRNWVLRMAFQIGVPPARLSRLYAPHAAAARRDPST